MADTSWFEAEVTVAAEAAELTALRLFELGASGLEERERGPERVLVAFFSGTPPAAAIRDATPPDATIEVREIPPQNWAETWKASFLPTLAGEVFRIRPPWAAAAATGRIELVIDPGMAFGTGQHETTRGCLALIEHAVARLPLGRALDLGTGSGILAIALAKLGVPAVVAIDTDPEACAATRANATANGVADQIQVRTTLDEVGGSFELVVANLFADLLIDYAPMLAHRGRAGAVVICSGLLTRDEDRVRTGYEAAGFRPLDRLEDSDWVTLAFERCP